MSSLKIILGVAGVVLLFVGSAYLSKHLSPDYKKIQVWNKAGVGCLTNGHTNLAQHIHQHLLISVNGTPEAIPANIGVLDTCLAEVHTHDGASEQNFLHVETVDANRTITLGQFFTVWGNPLERAGMDLVFKVNGATSTDPGNLVLTDQQTIELNYFSKK